MTSALLHHEAAGEVVVDVAECLHGGIGRSGADEAEIEALQERIAREYGLRLVDHRFELYGVPIRKDGD